MNHPVGIHRENTIFNLSYSWNELKWNISIDADDNIYDKSWLLFIVKEVSGMR